MNQPIPVSSAMRLSIKTLTYVQDRGHMNMKSHNMILLKTAFQFSDHESSSWWWWRLVLNGYLSFLSPSFVLALHIHRAAFYLDHPPADLHRRRNRRQLSGRQVANSWAEPRNRILVSASDPTSPSQNKTGVRKEDHPKRGCIRSFCINPVF